MRKSLLLLLTVSLGLLGASSNDLLANPNYLKADPVLSNLESNNSILSSKTVYGRFLAGEMAAPPIIDGCDGARSFTANGNSGANSCQAKVEVNIPTSANSSLVFGYPRLASAPTTDYSFVNGMFLPIGTDEIIYLFQNGEGSEECRIAIEVVDAEAPTLSLNSTATVNGTNVDGGCVDTLDLSGYQTTVSDCQAISQWFTVSGATTQGITTFANNAALALLLDEMVFNLGTSTVTFYAEDASGLSATPVSFNVVVTDVIDPVISSDLQTINGLVGNNIMAYVTEDRVGTTDACNALVSIIAPTASDACGDVTINYEVYNDLNVLVGTGSSSISNFDFEKGVSTVIYTITDESNNFVTDQLTVTVADTTAPVLAGCRLDTITFPLSNFAITANSCLANVAIEKVGAVDNCDIDAEMDWRYQIFSIDENGVWSAALVEDDQNTPINGQNNVSQGPTRSNLTPLAFEKGLYVARYVVEDASANISDTCNIYFEVIDDVAPVISAQNFNPQTIDVDAADECSANFQPITPTIDDNCSFELATYWIKQGTSPADTVWADTTNGSVLPHRVDVGVYTIQYVAFDEAGNKSAKQYTLTVQDTVNPEVDTYVFTDGGILAVRDTTINITSGSACSATVTRTFRATDNCQIDDIALANYSGTITGWNSQATWGTPTLSTAADTDLDGDTIDYTYSITFPAVNGVDQLVIVTVTDIYGNSSKDSIWVQVNDLVSGTSNQVADLLNQPADLDVCHDNKTFDLLSQTFGFNDPCGLDSLFLAVWDPSAIQPWDVDTGAAATWVNRDTLKVYKFNGTTSKLFNYDFQRGRTYLEYYAKDKNGNLSDVKHFIYEVVDKQHPVVYYPDTVNAFVGPFCDGATVRLVLDETLVEDNCTSDDYLLENAINDRTNFGDTATAFYSIKPEHGGPYHTVTFTIFDEAGNTSSKSFVIHVQDITDPNINANSKYETTNDVGKCSALAKFFAPVSGDNCGDIDIFYSINGGPEVQSDTIQMDFPVGVTTILWRAVDGSGNEATATDSVVVTDAEQPTVITPSNKVINNVPGVCGADTTFLVTIDDNCGIDSAYYWIKKRTATDTNTVAQGLVNGNRVGTFFEADGSDYEIMVTAYDIHGNQKTNTFVVEVIDTEKPMFICPGDQVLSTNSQSCSRTFDLFGDENLFGEVSDNCNVVDTIVTIDGTTSASNNTITLDKGTHTVSVSVVDENGNVQTCTVEIEVQNNNAPTVVSFPNDTIVGTLNNICSRRVFWAAPQAIDYCGDAITMTSSVENGDEFALGTTTVTYTFTNTANGQSTTESFTITVEDRQKPVINTLPANGKQFFVPSNGCLAEVVYTVNANDNCDAQGVEVIAQPGLEAQFYNPEGANLAPGQYTNYIRVQDLSGNYVDTNFQFVVIDNHAPVFTSTPSDITTCNPVVTYNVAANDNCTDGFSLTMTEGLASGSTFAVGTTTVTYVATDASGNSSTYSFNVTVLAAPTVANAGSNAVLCEGSSLSLNANAPAAGETGTWTVAGGAVVNNVNDPNSAVTFNTPTGTFQFTWTIDNGSGCEASSSTINVTIVAKPVAAAGADQVVDDEHANLDGLALNGTGVWSTTSTADIEDVNNPKSHVHELAEGDNVFTFTVSSDVCTSVSDQVTITYEPSTGGNGGVGENPSGVAAPLIITPNGDNDNDTWTPFFEGVDETNFSTVYPNAVVTVYGRWGGEVFKSEPGVYPVWNGTKNNDGTELPMASYYYVIDLGNNTQPTKGVVSIIK